MGAVSLTSLLWHYSIHAGTQVLPTFTLWHTLISSSILRPVTPAIATPTAYFRKYRIFEHLSQTRCSGWEGVGTRFGSPNSNCIRPVGAKSQEVAKPSHFTLYSCINVRGHKKDVFVFSLLPFTLLLFLGICFFIIPDPTCRFLHVLYFHSLH